MGYKYDKGIECFIDGVRVTAPRGTVSLGDVDNSYRALLFSQRGVAMIAVGCRRFTLREADIHWGQFHRGVHSLSQHISVGGSTEKAYKRAKMMINVIIPRAEAAARRRGWRLG